MMSIDKITLEITDKCNARCPQCMRTDPNGCAPISYIRNQDITLHKFKKLLPEEFLKTLKIIDFNCPKGDPAAHKNIFDILDYITIINPTVTILFPTNGSLKEKNFWTQLATYKHLQVTFAIDGIDQATHEFYRRNTNFNKIISNASHYISAGGNAYWQFIIFDHNKDQEIKAEIMSKELGFVGFESFNSNRFNGIDEFEYTYKDKKYILNSTSTVKKFRNNNTSNNCINCKSKNNNEIFIDIDGYIMPCCYHAGSLFAVLNVDNRTSFNNFVDVSFSNYDIEKFNIYKVGFNEAFKSYNSYMEDLEMQWKSLNPPLCNIVCGKNF